MAPTYQRLLTGIPLAIMAYWGFTCPCDEVMKCHWTEFWSLWAFVGAFVLITHQGSYVCD
jgi:hypothetical protein